MLALAAGISTTDVVVVAIPRMHQVVLKQDNHA